MNKRLTNGFIAGCLGAVILVIIMYIMKAMDKGEPGFVGMYRAVFGNSGSADEIIAALLFIISGGIWGLIFGWLVKYPSVIKGIIFGILPCLWLWTAIPAYLHKPMFSGFQAKGLIMPLVANMLVWGSFLGWYTMKRS